MPGWVKRLALGFTIAGAVTLLSIGWLAVPNLLISNGVWAEGGAPDVAPTVFLPLPDPDNQPKPKPGNGVAGVAVGAKPTGEINGELLEQQIAGLDTKGIGATAWLVTDRDGKEIAGDGAKTLMVPASTMKVLTAVSALRSMPENTRFVTEVKRKSRGVIVLVGGGDPLLATKDDGKYPHPPTLTELASQTSKKLKERNETSVTLGYNEDLFVGPDWHPHWPIGFQSDVTRISALMVDGGIQKNKLRTKTPALTAAVSFAALLTQEGITVTGTPTAMSADGDRLAAVQSLPLHTLVQQALLRSNNTATEVIMRQVAIASGKKASFAGGTEAVAQHLKNMKIWQDGAVIVDGSGISMYNRISPKMLAGAIQLVFADRRYRILLDALPVAGATGTLHDRFQSPQSISGRGWIRAKTGTLDAVGTLAGIARSVDGQNMVMVFMTNSVFSRAKSREWLDQAASKVANCGC